MSEYERGAEAMTLESAMAAARAIRDWHANGCEGGYPVSGPDEDAMLACLMGAIPTPPADPKPDAVAKKRPRKDASAVLREIEDFLGHIAMNGADAKDREVALALEQDAHVLAAEQAEREGAQARERFRDAAALAVIASITSAGSDQDERIKKAAWQTARTFFDAMREATEQAEREGGQA